MEIKVGMHFQGAVNGAVFRIVNVNDRVVTYTIADTGKTFTVGRKMFEHCLLKRI